MMARPTGRPCELVDHADFRRLVTSYRHPRCPGMVKPGRLRPAALGRARWPLLATGWLLACVLVGWVLNRLVEPDRWLDRRHDWQATWFAPAAPPLAALTVDVDEASLRRMGGWPLRRDSYVPAGQWLIAQGARAVAFGMLLVDAREGDAPFVAWLGQAPRPVLLGARSLAGDGESGLPQPAPPGCQPTRWPAGQLSVWARAGDASPALAIHRVGALSTTVDDDGRLRRMAAFQQAGDLVLPALPLAVWQAVHSDAAARLACGQRGADGDWLQAGSLAAWPMDAQHRLRPWLARAEAAPAPLPLWQVAEAAAGRLPAAEAAALAQAVRGRVVFIGSSGQAAGEALLTGQGWRHPTEWLAASYDALEHQRMLTPSRDATDRAMLAALLLPGLAALVSGWRRRGIRHAQLLLATLAATLLLLGVDTLLVAQTGRLSHLGWAFTTLAVVAGSVAWHAWHTARRSRQALVQARQEATALARHKGDFLAQVSHEVRTPLNALLGAAELLSGTALNETQRRHVALFSRAGQELLQMLNDLLDLSKGEAGLLKLQRHPFSLSGVVAEQVSMFQGLAAQKGLVLDTDTDPDLPEVVVGDAQRVSQVLRNLLANAVKFTPVGRVTLAMRFGSDQDHVRFEVRDTGLGMAADRMERLFAPYSQLHDAPGQRHGGTGLGLAISRRLVELMGGEIGAQSREGLGSTFHVVLPLPATAAAPRAPEPVSAAAMPAPAPLAPDGVPLRVLVADDSALNLMLLRAFLEGAGHQVDTVADGANALRHFERGGYQVVLVDLNMPVMDGLATVAAMRQAEQRRARPRTRMVVISGQVDAREHAAALQAGCDACLGKPYTRSQLLGMLTGVADPVTAALASGPADLGKAANSTWMDAISRLPDSNLPEAVTRLGGAGLYDRVLGAARDPLFKFEQRLAETLDEVPCDLDSAHRLAHDLKTLAATLGLPGLSADARRLEQALAETVAPGHDDAVRRARERLSTRLAQVCGALKQPAPPRRQASG
jgi:signal transduction histidine kinase/ActR/RegA family two-component response regulator/HPt (histidine-containing phosphotransfer) domain-containing protein